MFLLYTGECPLEKKTNGAAAFDLQCSEGDIVPPMSSAIIKTGLHVAIPNGYFGLLTLRSGHGFKKDLMSHIGIIDSDYRGEVMVKVFNFSDYTVEFEPGERFAQLTLIPLHPISAVRVDSLDTTERGEGGFGSTGK